MCTEFEAKPTELKNFSTALGYLADDVPNATAYCNSWVRKASDRDGIFANFCATATQVADRLNEDLERIRTILSLSSTEISKLADYYLYTDKTTAENLDRTYTDYQRTPTYTPQPGTGPLPDDPSAAIWGEPNSDNPIPVLGDIVLHAAGVLLSPTEIVLTIISWFCDGKNPLDESLKWVAGDWNAANQGSDALVKLAKFHGAMAVEINKAQLAVMLSWQGHSADAANSYFNRLVDAVDDLVPALNRISPEFHTVAYGMWSSAKALASLLSTISDLLIAAAISWAATGAVSWTGVGGLIGLLISSAETAALVKTVLKAYDVWNGMIACVDAFAGICAGYLGGLHSIDTINAVGTVSSPYDSPFV